MRHLPAILLLTCLTSTAGAQSVRGYVDRNVIREPIRRASGELRQCYERALRDDATLDGRLVVGFEVHPDGKVRRVEIVESELLSPELERCVLGVFRRLRFERVHGVVRVRYPLIFHPTN